METAEVAYTAVGQELVGTIAFPDPAASPFPGLLIAHEASGLDSYAGHVSRALCGPSVVLRRSSAHPASVGSTGPRSWSAKAPGSEPA